MNIHSQETSSTVVDGFTFVNGSVEGNGGAIYCTGSYPTIRNCIFRANTCTGTGGAIFSRESWPNPVVISNCIFNANVAGLQGGAVAGQFQPALKIVNSTFYGNSAQNYGGGIYFVDYMGMMDATIVNTILWANTANAGSQLASHGSAQTDVHHCTIQGGLAGVSGRPTWGIGNLTDDPMFIDPDGEDNIPGTADDVFKLLLGSESIDAGDNTAVTQPADIEGAARILNGTVDIGAHEFIPGNINGIGSVDLADLASFIANWSNDDCDPANNWCFGADQNMDGNVNLADLAIIASSWQMGP